MLLIIGIVAGGLVIGLYLWLQSKGIKPKWYEWLIGLIGLALVILGIENFAGLTVEAESTAATLTLLAMILPGLGLIALGWFMAVRRQRVTT